MDLEPGHIGISFDLAELETVIDVAIPFGLIFTELVSNTVRHAFPGQRRGTIEVRLKRTDPDFLEFVYRDDGIGIDPALDVRMSGTIGFQTIFALVEHQLQGSASFEPVGRGVKWIIRFSDTQFSARV